MKYYPALLVLFTTILSHAQSSMPDFLIGTWKMENKESYEHWDKLNENAFKGFSYEMKDGRMDIKEYLDIRKDRKNIKYSATVLKQNEGKTVDFVLTKSDNSYSFENLTHDFPKKIVYQKINESEILVKVTDGNQKGFSYTMKKQFQKTDNHDASITNPNYDKALADKLGGDEYGMKSYLFVLLKTGTNTTSDKELIANSFRGHMDNINRLVKEGKLIVAGPMGKNDLNYRGIFILNNIKTSEEAKELLQTDLAIQNGLLDYEIFNWYGSAALPEYIPFSEKIYKIKP